MKRVIIIGGGFAGSLIAKELEKFFDITLIDTKDYFEFTPGILRTIVEPNHLKKIQLKHSFYLKKTKIIIGSVSNIYKKFISVNKKNFSFDYLVICSGSGYNLPIKEQNVVIATRASHLIKSHTSLLNAKNILIIGGGLVGVELASEIITHYPDKKITIVHAKDKLIERNPLKASLYAEKFLKERGVKICFNEKIIKKINNKYLTDKGNTFNPDISFLCNGIKTNVNFMKSNFLKLLNINYQIKVNDFLQVDKFKYIFVGGDVNDKNVEKTAQNAEKQAKIIVFNIIALNNKRELKPYVSKKTPLVISLGKFDGILIFNNLVIKGIIPAFLKWVIEKIAMGKRKYFF